ncbi:hypothetical protein BKA62DRAFT_830741 [Auriculariales sp. MPI-PUGE-AT-0066]|nr:hypothetical protein BKA62DRAFT_830741 [Auriculariales sp. MPI-PUGE-AT-0066]
MVSPVFPNDAAVVVEDNDPSGAVTYGGDWTTDYDSSLYTGAGGTYHHTVDSQAFVQFTFTGTQVWYYSDTDSSHGIADVSLDGESPSRISSQSETTVHQKAVYSRTVPAGKHTLKITNNDASKVLGVDYFVYLPLQDSQSSDGVGPTNLPNNDAVKHVALSVGAAIGITLGIVALLLAVGVFLFIWLRKRKRERAGATPGPLTGPAFQPAPPMSMYTTATPQPTISTPSASVYSPYNPYSPGVDSMSVAPPSLAQSHDTQSMSGPATSSLGTSSSGAPIVSTFRGRKPPAQRQSYAPSLSYAQSMSGYAPSTAPPAYEEHS